MRQLLFTGLTLASFSAQLNAAEKCRDWSWEKGKRQSAKISLGADLCLAATRSPQLVNQVKSSGEVDAYLLNKKIPLLLALAQSESQSQDALSLNASLAIAGQKVWSPSFSTKTPSYSKSFTLPKIDVEFPYGLQLGPIGVKVAVGVNGQAGVDLSASAELAQLKAQAQPKINASAYTYANIDLWLADVGAEGSMLLAQGGVQLEAVSNINLKQNKAYLTGLASGSYELRALNGELKVYADTKGNRQNRQKHSWEKELVGFDGYQLSGTMFQAAIPEVAIY